MTVDVRIGTESVHRGPIAGLVGQLAVLGVLAAEVGLHSAGWLAGIIYAVVTWAALTSALERSGVRALGPANAVTLGRATLVGGVAALVADSLVHRPAPVAVLVAVATVALILDGVDGRVARMTGTSSPMGARFDGEIDAFLILVLSAFVAESMGIWVLAIGAFRYAFVAASWVLPWLRTSLPRRISRSSIAAVQGIVLVVASAGLVPMAIMMAVVAASLALLTWSFVRDVRWLWLQRVPVVAERSAARVAKQLVH